MSVSQEIWRLPSRVPRELTAGKPQAHSSGQRRASQALCVRQAHPPRNLLQKVTMPRDKGCQRVFPACQGLMQQTMARLIVASALQVTNVRLMESSYLQNVHPGLTEKRRTASLACYALKAHGPRNLESAPATCASLAQPVWYAQWMACRACSWRLHVPRAMYANLGQQQVANSRSYALRAFSVTSGQNPQRSSMNPVRQDLDAQQEQVTRSENDIDARRDTSARPEAHLGSRRAVSARLAPHPKPSQRLSMIATKIWSALTPYAMFRHIMTTPSTCVCWLISAPRPRPPSRHILSARGLDCWMPITYSPTCFKTR